MKKILLILSILLIALNAYAQEVQDNATAKPKGSDTEVKADKKAKKPDFNKKKISLDRIDEKKWSLRVGYSYFFPESKYASIFTHKLKIGGAYDFNKYFQVQALLQYADGSASYDINGVNTNFSGTIYNLGAVATGLYPIEMSVGELAPFASLGGVYTFGNVKSTANGAEQKQNISGGGILAQAGLQYNFNVFSFRVYGEYIYDLTPIKIDHLKTFSGVSIGGEIGVKF